MSRFPCLAVRLRAIYSVRSQIFGMFLWMGLSGCQSVFLSGRPQLDLLPEKQEIALGVKAYQEVLQTEPKSQNAHLSQMLDRVGQRLAAVSERPEFQWEFTLLSGPTANAFCLPGGKVAVYEGILPVCSNEAGLAVVMSHEIAHALSRHGGERMTHQMAAESGDWALSRILENRDAQHIEMVKTVYGLGSQYGVLLPFSRTQEAEADSIGLLLMARAGYDPQEAPRFWARFSQTSGTKTPELLSSHPSDETRTAKLIEIVPRALSVYQSAPQRHGLGEQIPMQALAQLVPKGAPPLQTPPPQAEGIAISASLTASTKTAPVVAVPVTPELAASKIGAMTVAPAPIVQTTATAKIASPPVTPNTVRSSPEFGAPTVESTLLPPAPALIVSASAETVAASHPIITALATETSTQPGTVTESQLGPVSPLPEVAADETPASSPEASDGWKPHAE